MSSISWPEGSRPSFSSCPAHWNAMISDTGKPSPAYWMAGWSSSDIGMVPHSASRVSHPWTAPGDGHRMDAALWHGPVSFGLQRVDGRCFGRPAAAVDGPHRLVPVVPHQGEHVTADAGGHRLDHVQHCRAGHCRVNGVAPLHQDPHTGNRCQGLAGGDHPHAWPVPWNAGNQSTSLSNSVGDSWESDRVRNARYCITAVRWQEPPMPVRRLAVLRYPWPDARLDSACVGHLPGWSYQFRRK